MLRSDLRTQQRSVQAVVRLYKMVQTSGLQNKPRPRRITKS